MSARRFLKKLPSLFLRCWQCFFFCPLSAAKDSAFATLRGIAQVWPQRSSISPRLSMLIAQLLNAWKNSLLSFNSRGNLSDALPLPPSLWHWDGLINTPHGVYEVRVDLSERPDLASVEHRYYPDAPPNQYIDAAKRLPEVQKVLWFSRFPVTRFHKEGSVAVVEFFDARFSSIRRDRPTSFTYRVKMDETGQVISKGWARE